VGGRAPSHPIRTLRRRGGGLLFLLALARGTGLTARRLFLPLALLLLVRGRLDAVHQLEQDQRRVVAGAAASLDEACVAAMAVADAGGDRAIARTCRRAWRVSRLASVIICSASPRTAFALASVVWMRSCRKSATSRFRKSAQRWAVTRPSLNPSLRCLIAEPRRARAPRGRSGRCACRATARGRPARS